MCIVVLLQATTTGFHQSASNGSLEQTSNVQVLPAAEYMRVNDLLVHGEGPHDHVPEPCQTFESAGYPADLLEEVGLLSCDDEISGVPGSGGGTSGCTTRVVHKLTYMAIHTAMAANVLC